MKKRSGLIAAVAIASTLLVTAPAHATATPPPTPSPSPSETETPSPSPSSDPTTPAEPDPTPSPDPTTPAPDPLDPRGPQIPSQPAPALPVPSNVSCGATIFNVTPDGKLLAHTYNYENGVGTIGTFVYGDQLGYVPRTLKERWVPDSTSDTGYRRHWLATSPDGKLNDVQARPDMTLASASLSPSWKAVRNLTGNLGPSDVSYLYGLNDDGNFYRYTYRDDQVGNPTSRVTIGGSGWGKVKTLSVRERTDPSVERFVGTTSTGKLAEYSFPLDNPAKATSKVLLPDSWQNIVSLNVGSCVTWGSDGYGRQNSSGIMVGTIANGDAYLYFDKNWNDGSGADIVALGKIASGWTGKNYSN